MVRIMNNRGTARPASRILVAGAVRRDVNGAGIRRHSPIILTLVPDGHSQPFLVTFGVADVKRIALMQPHCSPCCGGCIEKIVLSDPGWPVQQMSMDVWEYVA